MPVLGFEQNASAIVAKHLESIPVDLKAIAAELGIDVYYEALPATISGKITRDSSAWSEFRITINSNDPRRRQRFTFAHEIGHYVLHRDLITSGVIDNEMYRSAALSDDYERQANRFAAQILLPTGALRSAYRRHKSLAELTMMFDVSEAALRIRLSELGLVA